MRWVILILYIASLKATEVVTDPYRYIDYDKINTYELKNSTPCVYIENDYYYPDF